MIPGSVRWQIELAFGLGPRSADDPVDHVLCCYDCHPFPANILEDCNVACSVNRTRLIKLSQFGLGSIYRRACIEPMT